MLLIKLMGGLGNQLFQIFTLISLSLDNNIDFKIFEYKDDIVKRNTYWDTIFKNIYDKTFKSISGSIYQYNEQNFHYTPFPKIKDTTKDYNLSGYFQSHKYFQDNLDKILDLLKWNIIKKPYENKYDYKNTVSLHFRIGDYINLQTYHPILSIDYYINTLDKLIVDTNKNDWNILYFYEKSDKDTVNKNIEKLKNLYPNLNFIEIDHNLDDWEQMICMTYCSHNIIANSTFSWWGAYLNNNDNHVYYPDIWFGSSMKNKDLKDLFLDNWNEVAVISIYKKYTDYIKNTQLKLLPKEWNFKSHPDYTYMLEHVNYLQGLDYLKIIKNNFSDFYKKYINYLIDLCNLNDKYGKTIKYNFQNFTKCSPTNLRYILHSLLILEDIKKYNLNSVDIIEIGGGYGGLCFYIFKIAKIYNIDIKTYTIFDLLEASKLQSVYLKSLNIENCNFYQLDNYDKLNTNSFLVSTYAYSEIPMSIQKEYSEKIINIYTKYGFIAWNNIPVYNFGNNINIEKEIEYPLTSKNNYFVRYN